MVSQQLWQQHSYSRIPPIEIISTAHAYVVQECLKEWAKAKSAVVSCPFCRADWEFGDKKQVCHILITPLC